MSSSTTTITIDIYGFLILSSQPITTHVKFTSAHPFTPQFVQAQLCADTDTSRARARARALYEERVRRRQIGLVERSRARALQKEKEKGRKGKEKGGGGGAKATGARMGRREAAEKGVWRLREEEARWDAFVPLHRLWLGYMSELLGLAAAPEGPEDGGGSGGASSSSAAMSRAVAAGMHAKLLKADFHGSIVTVRRSKNAALVGTSGIVVQETENTFKVVTRKDKLKVLPKQGSVFAFAVPLHSTEAAVINSGTNDGEAGCGRGGTVQDGAHIELELYGNQFRFRAADRAGRKFKHKESIVL